MVAFLLLLHFVSRLVCAIGARLIISDGMAEQPEGLHKAAGLAVVLDHSFLHTFYRVIRWIILT